MAGQEQARLYRRQDRRAVALFIWSAWSAGACSGLQQLIVFELHVMAKLGSAESTVQAWRPRCA